MGFPAHRQHLVDFSVVIQLFYVMVIHQQHRGRQKHGRHALAFLPSVELLPSGVVSLKSVMPDFSR